MNRSPSPQNRPTQNTAARRAEALRRRKHYRNRRILIYTCLILLVAAAIFAVTLLIKNMASPSVPANSQNSPENSTPVDPEDSVPLLATKMIGENEYFPLSAFSEYGVSLNANGSDATISLSQGEQTAYFSAGKLDCIINDKAVILPRAAFADASDFYLPTSFVCELFGGLTLTKTDGGYLPGGTVTLFNTPDNAQSIRTDVNASLYLSFLTQTPTFKNDLSEYESSMNPGAGTEYLTLVNVSNPLPEDYAPTDLVALSDARYSGEYEARLRSVAAKSLTAFLIEARSAGVKGVSVTSGYRSYAEQNYRFNAKVQELRSSYSTLEEAQNAAANAIQWPGKSEHQSGLALDMHNLASADESFGQTQAGQWLAENAHNFGFILRYPSDKTEITGIQYEPWHFRYVGRYHATRMYLLNMTLEEYTVFINGGTVRTAGD